MNTMTDDMPMAAVAARMLSPVADPANVTNPARIPPDKVLAMIRLMFGPGVSANSKHVAMKASRTVVDTAKPQMSVLRALRARAFGRKIFNYLLLVCGTRDATPVDVCRDWMAKRLGAI